MYAAYQNTREFVESGSFLIDEPHSNVYTSFLHPKVDKLDKRHAWFGMDFDLLPNAWYAFA